MQRQPESEDHEDEVHHPESHDGLLLAPALELEMMVKGRHGEDFAAEEIARTDLDDDGQGLDIEHEAEERERAKLADGQGVHGQQGAQAERADVAHHESRRLDIEISVRGDGSDGGGVQDGDLAEAVDPREQGESAEGRDEHAPGQAIHAVGDVDCVGREHDHQDDDRHDHPAGVDRPAEGKVDEMPGWPELVIDPPGGDRSGDELQYELLMDEDAAPSPRTEPDGHALEGGPWQSDEVPERA